MESLGSWANKKGNNPCVRATLGSFAGLCRFSSFSLRFPNYARQDAEQAREPELLSHAISVSIHHPLSVLRSSQNEAWIPKLREFLIGISTDRATFETSTFRSSNLSTVPYLLPEQEARQQIIDILRDFPNSYLEVKLKNE